MAAVVALQLKADSAGRADVPASLSSGACGRSQRAAVHAAAAAWGTGE